MDGEWREARNQTEEAVCEIEGGAQKVGFGDHTDKKYVEVLTMSPKYADHLMADGKQEHLEVKEFAMWITRGGNSR